MVEIGFSLVTTTTILIINAKANRTDTDDIPTWVRIIFFGFIANLLKIRKNDNEKKSLLLNNTSYTFGNNEKRRKLLEKHNAEQSIQLMLKRCVYLTNSIEERDRETSLKMIEDQLALQNLLAELRTVNSALHSQRNLQYNHSDWKFLCQIVDRLIFYIFFLTIVSSAFLILLPVYMIYN